MANVLGEMSLSQVAGSRGIVTGTGATGFQVSSAKDSLISYSVTVTATSSIGSASSGTVVLEIASTNSATAGDWIEIARFTNGQTLTLAALLQSVQALAGSLMGYLPAGFYAKLRSINNSGTPGFAFNSGQEIVMG